MSQAEGCCFCFPKLSFSFYSTLQLQTGTVLEAAKVRGGEATRELLEICYCARTEAEGNGEKKESKRRRPCVHEDLGQS